jgi:hypothetical protein
VSSKPSPRCSASISIRILRLASVTPARWPITCWAISENCGTGRRGSERSTVAWNRVGRPLAGRTPPSPTPPGGFGGSGESDVLVARAERFKPTSRIARRSREDRPLPGRGVLFGPDGRELNSSEAIVVWPYSSPRAMPGTRASSFRLVMDVLRRQLAPPLYEQVPALSGRTRVRTVRLPGTIDPPDSHRWATPRQQAADVATAATAGGNDAAR